VDTTQLGYALHPIPQAVAVNTQRIGTRLTLAVVFAPTAQGRQQLTVGVLGQHFAQRVEQFVEGVFITVSPEHHGQAITVERQQPGV
ncbi:hypothetical protein NK362_26045, partial [Salmonella enterica]